MTPSLDRRRALQLLGALATTPWLPRPAAAQLVFTGENPLGVSRALFRYAQEGLDLMYRRRYPEALERFEEAGVDFPDSPLGPLGRAITYQSMMFENYDLRYARVYAQEAAEVEDRFRSMRGGERDRPWSQFLQGAFDGIEAIHLVRKDEYLSAFNRAWGAIEQMKKVVRAVPDFADAHLALGLYDYWRTVFTEQLDGLPSFGDHRAEGLAQMELARDQGLLAAAPASLSLAFSYLEAKDYDKALAEVQRVRESHPESIVNEMVGVRILRQARRWDAALEGVARVRQLDPTNTRVFWLLGEIHYKRRKDNAAARDAYQRYLDSGPLPEYRAHAQYRMGLIARRERKFDEAIRWLKRSSRSYPKFKRAKEKLAEVEAQRDRRSKRKKRRGKKK